MADTSEIAGHSFGFITVRVHPDLGYFGGCLLLNHLARPLEFHCTLPVKASRAHEILYGQTLESYLCGEQIARALIKKVKIAPTFVFTDCDAVLSLRHVYDKPVALVVDSEETVTGAESRMKLPRKIELATRSIKLDQRELRAMAVHADDLDTLQRYWKTHSPQIDFQEPFGRICEALQEANPSAKAA